MALSWLDTVLILLILFQLLLGFQQGLALGVLSLFGYALALLVIMVASPWLASWAHHQWNWPVTPVLLISAVVLIVFIRFATGWVTAGVHLNLEKRPRTRQANRWLGLLPGALWAYLSALLLTWLYSGFAGALPPHSEIASRLLASGEKPLNEVVSRLPGGLPNIVLMPSGWEVVAGDSPNVHVPPSQLEKEMLTLVNQERTKRGLKALKWDDKLAEVAHRRSNDMLAHSYFAHEDPQGKTVADVARKVGVGYFVIGENLAFAPTLAIAHRGLMESPGHRENILRPGFDRVGIGIVRIPAGSTYLPIHHGKKPPKPLRGYGGYLLVTQVFKR
jgi:uncharacterized membrane protein required for colicin V production